VPHGQPFALVETGPNGLVLSAVDERARRIGLGVGLALADARAVFPGLVTRPAEPARDRATLIRLAGWVGRYGPSRNIDGVDGLWSDVTGVAHLFGGEAALLADLERRLASIGFAARLALADTYGGAHALARFGAASSAGGKRIVVCPGETRSALASLPVAALRISQSAVVLLQRLGLYRIGQLYDLPRAALARRFREAPGTRRVGGRRADERSRLAGTVLDRLDRALGAAEEPLAGLREPPSYVVRRDFPEPIAASAVIEAVLGQLADEMALLLAGRGEGARRFELALYRADGSAAEIAVGTSAPVREGRHVATLLGQKLENVDAGLGADALMLAARRVEPMAAAQAALDAAGVPVRSVDGLLDRLSNRLGAERVVRLTAVASHLPERAERSVPALLGTPEKGGAECVSSTGPPRPAFLLSPPEPITVVAEVPEGPPLRFKWRRVHHAIVRAEGPERIAPEWWRHLRPSAPPEHAPTRAPPCDPVRAGPPLPRPDAPLTRDYYRVEDSRGAAYWVFRNGLYGEVEAGPPAWFLHGVFA
jgi:protein ImuB